MVLAAVVLVVLLAVGWFWGRDSSLVQVQKVTVTGTAGSTGGEIERTLITTARAMTTLDFDPAKLRAAMAPYPVVKSIEVRTKFPHEAFVVVHRRTPVATIAMGGKDVPVSADGVLLTGTVAKGVPALSAAKLPVAGRVTELAVLDETRVLAGATAAQRKQVTHIGTGVNGVEVRLGSGPVAYFGDGVHPRDQWVALKRVLADPGSQGAAYIDVSVAERPAAGGFDDGSDTSADGSTDTSAGDGSDTSATDGSDPSADGSDSTATDGSDTSGDGTQ
jgi:cell division protein FtsQ